MRTIYGSFRFSPRYIYIYIEKKTNNTTSYGRSIAHSSYRVSETHTTMDSFPIMTQETHNTIIMKDECGRRCMLPLRHQSVVVQVEAFRRRRRDTGTTRKASGRISCRSTTHRERTLGTWLMILMMIFAVGTIGVSHAQQQQQQQQRRIPHLPN